MPIPVERYTTVPLFDGLSSDEIMALLQISETAEADLGDVLIQEGEPGDGFYVIASGAFEVTLRHGRTNERRFARLEELASFGEMSLVRDEDRACSVVCVSAGRLKRFPAQSFRALVDEGNVAAYKAVWNMCRILADRLARVESEL